MKYVFCIFVSLSLTFASSTIISGDYQFSAAPSSLKYWSGDIGSTSPIQFAVDYTGQPGSLNNVLGSDSGEVTWSNGSNQLGSSGVTIIFDLESEYYIDQVSTYHTLSSYYGVGVLSCYTGLDGISYTLMGSDGVAENGPADPVSRNISFDRVLARYVKLQVASVSWRHLAITKVVISGEPLDADMKGKYTFSVAATGMKYWSGDTGTPSTFAYQPTYVGQAGELNSVLGGDQGVVTWYNGSNQLGSSGVEIIFELKNAMYLEQIITTHNLDSYYGVGPVDFYYSLDGVNFTSAGSDGVNQTGPVSSITRSVNLSSVLAKFVKLQVHSVAWNHLQLDKIEILGVSIPWIEIRGLANAQKWSWTEAENNLIAANSASGYFKDSSSLSNHANNPDAVLDNWISGGGWSEYLLFIPDDIDNARLYLRYGIDRTTDASNIYIDGTLMGQFVHTQTGNYDIPVKLSSSDYTSLGSLTKGLHILKIQHPGSYALRSYDGFFIYDGSDIVIDNSTVSFGKDSWGPYYMEAPSSSNYPVIGKWAKPKISFNGRDDNQEFETYLIKNGSTPKHYRPGQIIDEPGEYKLVCFIAEDGWSVVAYSGANFEIAAADSGDQLPASDSIPLSLSNDFPIGWYDTVGPWTLPELSENGFNCTNPYGARGGYLNIGEEVGVSVFQYVYGAGQDLTDFVEEYKVSPAISCWNLADEPVDQGVTLTEFQARSNTVKAADPDRDVTAVFCLNDYRILPYLDCIDFPMIDCYPVYQNDPVPSPNMYIVAKQTNYVAGQCISAGKGAPIFVSQAFGGYGNPVRREPTKFESRYMTFAPVICGARGILYYAYFDASSSLKSDVYDIAAELNSMVPVILSTESMGSIYVTSNNDFDSVSHGVNDVAYLLKKTTEAGTPYYYLICANNKGQAVSNVNFSFYGLPSGSYAAEVIGESRSISLSGSAPHVLSDDFNNYDVHIYKVGMN